MNRGQAPQRPPNLVPNQSQAMSNAFRAPYNPAAYGMGPPRTVGVIQGYPNVPNHTHTHRSQPQQSLLGGPSPGLFSQRSSNSGFPFTLGLHQQHPAQHTQSSTSLPPHLQHQQPPQQQSQSQTQAQAPTQQQQQVSSSTTLGNSSSGSSAPPPTGSGASETGLDPNDFPALGSALNGSTNGNSNGSGSVQTPLTPATLPSSYASQAGTGVPLTSGIGSGASGLGGSGGSGQPLRDFGPDDFPALGQNQSQSSTSGNGQENHGLNGFTSEGSRTAVSIAVGALASRAGGFGADTESRKFPLKGSNSNPSASLSWTSPNPSNSALATPAAATPFSSTLTNGSTSHQPQQSLVPPGVPPLSSAFPIQQTNHNHGPNPNLNNLNAPSQTTQNPQSFGTDPSSTNNGSSIPQTPAQQVLMSPADRWGLLGLLAMIRSSDPETTLLSIGTDLGTMGLDMQTPGSLYSTFITPWSDSSAAHLVEPDFHLPACYNVQPATLNANKAAAFSDETLFFMFYAHPRDMYQEIAAQELWNRNWRFHKESRVWLTKETGTSPSQKQHGGETGMFTLWDSENWEKARKRMHVAYSDLEEKTSPVFTPAQAQASQGPVGQTQPGMIGVPTQQRDSNSTVGGGPSGLPLGRFAGMGMSIGA